VPEIPLAKVLLRSQSREADFGGSMGAAHVGSDAGTDHIANTAPRDPKAKKQHQMQDLTGEIPGDRPPPETGGGLEDEIRRLRQQLDEAHRQEQVLRQDLEDANALLEGYKEGLRLPLSLFLFFFFKGV